MKKYALSGFIAQCLVFLGTIMVSSVAQSTEYFYCYVLNHDGKQLRYYSDILATQAKSIDETRTGFAFCDEVDLQSRRDYPGDGNAQCHCESDSKLSRLEKEYRKLPTYYSGPARKHAFTRPPVPSTEVVRETPVPGTITVTDSKPAPPSPKTLAERAALEQEAAAKRARLAAASAKHDDEMQAALAEQLRLRKLQGMKQ